MPGSIEVEPNPVAAGGQVELSHSDGDALYYWDISDPAAGWQEVPMHDGKGILAVPPGSRGLFVSNRRAPIEDIEFVDVMNTGV